MRFNANQILYVGELPAGTSARVQHLVEAFSRAGLQGEATAHMQTIEWSKFVAWLGSMGWSMVRQKVGQELRRCGGQAPADHARRPVQRWLQVQRMAHTPGMPWSGRFCQLVEANTLIRRTDIPPLTDPSLMQSVPYLSPQSNSRSGSS